MADFNEYRESAIKMGQAIAQAANERGRIAVEAQEAERREKRRDAADKWADDPSVPIEAMDVQGEPHPDGPIPTEEGRKELDGVLAKAYTDARYQIGPQLTASKKLYEAAPQDLTNLVLSMQLRSDADFYDVADLYRRCASVSWPLAKSVADAARKFGLLIVDEQGTLDAEAPRALMRKAEELIAMIEGKAGKRPTTPGLGAHSAKHGNGSYAELELLDALDGAAVDFDAVNAELADRKALTAVYDADTGAVTAVRAEKGGELDKKAMRRIEKAHEDAANGSGTDFAAIDARTEHAFRIH